MTGTVAVTRVQDDIYAAECRLDEGMEVRALLVLGARRAAVIDTLTSPEEMAPFLSILSESGRPAIVVNTHADWDHVWGNAAFPGAMVVGHRICRQRLLGEEERRVLDEKRAERPDRYAQVRLVPPDLTFDTALALDLGGLTLELHHLPGHTEDCLMAYLPERRLLFAGDCAEEPFPLLSTTRLESWAAGLRAWSERDLATVIPAHGRIGGASLLRENAAYLEALRGPDVMPSLGRLNPTAAAFYRESHAQNRAMARSSVV